ncbi:MAG: hypothetical protein KDD40_09315 [Bdellovibrionales bacterium]|nr:hypothetical protein [Bdellovibrionales bacterium]
MENYPIIPVKLKSFLYIFLISLLVFGYSNSFANGNRLKFVILLGVSQAEIEKDTYDELGIKFLKKGVEKLKAEFNEMDVDLEVINEAKYYDFKDAVASNYTLGVIWIGHGGKKGLLLDSNNLPFTHSYFEQISFRLRYVGIMSCFSSYTLDGNNELESSVDYLKVWDSEISGAEIIAHLFSSDTLFRQAMAEISEDVKVLNRIIKKSSCDNYLDPK